MPFMTMKKCLSTELLKSSCHRSLISFARLHALDKVRLDKAAPRNPGCGEKGKHRIHLPARRGIQEGRQGHRTRYGYSQD
jgi:hypothetical protein